MPVSFLSATQRERYGQYPGSLTTDELARYFHLDDDDHEWIATKRRDSSRLGYALQLTTVRFLGTFLEDPTAVPGAVLRSLSTQLDIDIVDLADGIVTTSQPDNAGSTPQRFVSATAIVNSRTPATNFVLVAGCAPCVGLAPTAPACCLSMPIAG